MIAALFFEYAVMIEYGILLLAFLLGLFNFRKLSIDQRQILLLLAVTLFVELCSDLLWRAKRNNLFLFHFYAVFEFLLLTTIYRRHLVLVVSRPVGIGVQISFVAFAIINSLFIQSLTEFNSYTITASSFVLMIFAMTLCYYWIARQPVNDLLRLPMFWINLSVITYFSGAFTLFYFSNHLLALSEETRQVLWGTHAIFNIAHYLLYMLALVLHQAQSQTKKYIFIDKDASVL